MLQPIPKSAGIAPRLHGPDGKDCINKIGTEVWAYLPSNFLTEVKNLADSNYGVEAAGACSHRFMVDLAPRAWEVFFDNEATDSSKIPWHTVLIGGERGGGDMYFGLDVTDPYCPKVLWEYSVLKDMVAKFDFEAAEPAFRQACATGTPISPGQIVSGCKVRRRQSSVVLRQYRHPGGILLRQLCPEREETLLV